jgi:glutamine synthetase
MVDEVFNQEFIDYWIAARIRDHQAVAGRPHPYEIELYYDA